MKTCRICWEGEKPDDPIIKRCDCKECLVHNSCLEKWILLKKNTKCEICLKNFGNLEIVTQFKKGPEIFQTLLPIYSGLFIIFITFSNFVFMDNSKSTGDMEKDIKNKRNLINAFGFCLLALLFQIVNTNPLKDNLMEIKGITFQN
jgi:E3 ubiquitin-protein ligase DOA10